MTRPIETQADLVRELERLERDAHAKGLKFHTAMHAVWRKGRNRVQRELAAEKD
jgi:hypothetical protein